jgi:hypothetical protein
VVSQSEASQEQGVVEQVEYSQQGSQRNARGDPERLHEHAIIPLRHVADNPQAQTDLQNVINRFK